MNRTRTFAGGIVATLVTLVGCAAPGSTASARSGVSPLPSSAVASPASAASPAPASSAGPGPASSSDAGIGDTRPPCPWAQFQLILGAHTQSVWTTPTLHRPFGDLGVNFGPQMSGATVLWARLDVVPTDIVPMSFNPTADPRVYASAEAARPDSEDKLAAGTDPHVARVTLKPFAPGPFVLPAAVLNALPTGAGSYTVYLVDSVDESACFSTASGSPATPPFLLSGYSVIAVLVP